MTKPFDVSKFRKSVTKNISGISTGFHDPVYWISTGNYCLNYLISGDFNKGVPYGKVTCFAGSSGSGKSLICSASIVKNAQEDGAFVVLLDSENALDKSWLEALGVDTSEDKLLRVGISMIDDVSKLFYSFVQEYKSDYEDLPIEEQPKMLFVIDSLGMLQTPTSLEQFAKGDMKGDMGIKAKQLKSFVSNAVNMIAPHNISLLATNHTYASQDMFDPDDKISGGEGFIYASSIVVAMKKKKLKEDESGNKISDVRGIKASCKVVKSRYSKPFETVDVYIPYDTGLDPYSGLFELFEKSGTLKKVGNRYSYVSKETGEEFKEFKKVWKNTPELLDMVMREFSSDDFEIKDVEIEEHD